MLPDFGIRTLLYSINSKERQKDRPDSGSSILGIFVFYNNPQNNNCHLAALGSVRFDSWVDVFCLLQFLSLNPCYKTFYPLSCILGQTYALKQRG